MRPLPNFRLAFVAPLLTFRFTFRTSVLRLALRVALGIDIELIVQF